MTHPKRADHFKKWAALMLEQALVPERLSYKGTSSTKRAIKGKTTRSGRRKRFLRRKRRRKE